MRNTIKYIVGATWQPWVERYLSKSRNYRSRGIDLEIPVSVFHPGFFFSTNLLLNQIKALPLKGLRFLEPGAGSGLISIFAAKQGALVTATDINPAAVESIRKNSLANNVHITTFQSDLFDDIPLQTFDLVVINPPYYKKDPVSFADFAWNCGKDGEYFQKLFSQLQHYTHKDSRILMVLCDGCDIMMVKTMAEQFGFFMKTIFTRQNLIERNFIYSIETRS